MPSVSECTRIFLSKTLHIMRKPTTSVWNPAAADWTDSTAAMGFAEVSGLWFGCIQVLPFSHHNDAGSGATHSHIMPQTSMAEMIEHVLLYSILYSS